MEQEIAKLQVQLHQANATIADQKQFIDKLQGDVGKLVDANRRGDQEYRKLQAIIAKSKEMQHLSAIMEEKETYVQQSRALQELLRQNAEELEKYKRLVASAGEHAVTEAASGSTSNNDAAAELTTLRESVVTLEQAVKSIEDKLATAQQQQQQQQASSTDTATTTETSTSTSTSGGEATTEGVVTATTTGGDSGESSGDTPSVSVTEESKTVPEVSTEAITALTAELQAAKDELATARDKLAAKEDEMSSASSAAIRASRARERMEREAREKEAAMTQALANKEQQVVQLMRKVDMLEANHTKDLQGLYLKLKERDNEVESIRAQAQKDVATMQKKLEDASRTVATSDTIQRLTEASKVASAAIEALEAANKELEDKVRAKDKKIETLTQAKGEAEAHLRDVTAALDETASALAVSEKAEGELRSRTSHMETQIAAQNDELEELRPMKSGYDTVKASAVKYEAAYNDAMRQLQECEQRLANVQLSLTEAETRIEDQKAEHAIATRMLKQMNKELKSQLAKERQKAPSSPRTGTTPSGIGTSPLLTPMVTPSSTSLIPPRPPTTSTTTPDSNGGAFATRRDSGTQADAGDSEDMVQLLANRIQSLLAENESVKEKIRFLETIVRDLTVEKDNYKSMMKQLTSSKSVVEGTTSTAQTIVDRATRSENPIRVLQTLLLKALTENERLKSDLKVLGAEVLEKSSVSQ